MASELQELVGFLHHHQPAIRQIALNNLVGYSQGDKTYIFKENDLRPVRDLKILARHDEHGASADIVRDALTVLVNLCDDREIIEFLCQDQLFLAYVATTIVDLSQINADLLCMLLANLAKHDTVTSIFDIKVPARDPAVFLSDNVVDCLVDCFVKGASRTLNKYATFDFLAYFFADLSRLKQGRTYFATQQNYDKVVPLTKLLVFTEIESKTRRAGVASTIKNTLFDTSGHDRLVFNSEMALLPHILLPLVAGTDEYREDEMLDMLEDLQFLDKSKTREPDANILATHVESLLILSTSKPIREHMRQVQVYAVVRELHKNVAVDVVQDPCERLVQVLARDDAPENAVEERVEEMDSDDEIVEVA